MRTCVDETKTFMVNILFSHQGSVSSPTSMTCLKTPENKFHLYYIKSMLPDAIYNVYWCLQKMH